MSSETFVFPYATYKRKYYNSQNHNFNMILHKYCSHWRKNVHWVGLRIGF